MDDSRRAKLADALVRRERMMAGVAQTLADLRLADSASSREEKAPPAVVTAADELEKKSAEPEPPAGWEEVKHE